MLAPEVIPCPVRKNHPELTTACIQGSRNREFQGGCITALLDRLLLHNLVPGRAVTVAPAGLLTYGLAGKCIEADDYMGALHSVRPQPYGNPALGRRLQGKVERLSVTGQGVAHRHSAQLFNNRVLLVGIG